MTKRLKDEIDERRLVDPRLGGSHPMRSFLQLINLYIRLLTYKVIHC